MAKAKVTITGIFSVRRRIRKFFNQTINDRGFLNSTGKLMVRNNRADVRLGKDPSTGAPMKPLSAAWIKRRGKLEEVNRTDRLYQQAKSNLTFTGQLLKAIGYQIGKTFFSNRAFLEITLKDKRRAYKNLNGKRMKNTPTNAEIVEYQASMGRNTLGVSQKTSDIISKRFRRLLRRRLRSR